MVTRSLSAALYSRVSTEEQARQGVSLIAQQEIMVSYCRAHQWDIYDFYTDDGYSGKDINRPALKRLLDDAKRKRFDVVVVWKLDRLSRRQFDILNIIENILTPNGIGFKSVTESFDTTTPWGKAAMSMMAVFAQLERETIVERTRMGLYKIIESGRWKGGRTTFGYKYTPISKGGSGILEVDPEAAEIVRLIFDLYVKHNMGFERIAAYLNGDNEEKKVYPTPKGGKYWLSTTVHQILTNPVYIGKAKLNGELIDAKHKPIIDESLWNEAQKSRKKRSTRRVRYNYLLSGLLRCDVCGAAVNGKGKWTNWPKKPKKILLKYICINKRGNSNKAAVKECNSKPHDGETLEAQVLEILGEMVVSEEVIQEALKSQRPSYNIDELMQRLKQIDDEVEDRKKALSRYYDAFEAGLMSPEDVSERIRSINAQIDELNMEKHRIQSIIDQSAEERSRIVKRAKEIALKLKPALEVQDRKRIRPLLTNLIEEIRVGKDGEVTYIKWK